MKRIEMELSSLQVDPRLTDLRPVNEYVVSKYRQAMRTGAEFPVLKVAKDGRVICGNHRYTAMLLEFGKEHKTKVEVHTLPDYAAELVLFASDNAAHGMPLDGFSRRRVAAEMAKHGKTPEEIARVFNVPAVAVEKWGGQTVVVRPCGKGRKKALPVKRGVPEGKEITAEQYEIHKRRDYAIPARHIARQLIRWMENGMIDKDDEGETAALIELRAALVANGY